MSPVIIMIILACVGGIALLSSDFLTNKDQRKRHLEALVKLLDAKISQIESRPNCFRLEFEYRHQQFVYEDIEDKVMDKAQYRGYLKLPTPLDLTLSFTERLRTQIRSSSPAFGDLSQQGANWKPSEVMLPASLREFSAFSNVPELATQLFSDEAVARIFAKYKNRDTRGKPSLSMEVVDGIIMLRFYPPGELNPTILDLRNNTPLIENYLEDMLIISACMTRLKEDQK
jgi:hypothetical protein